MFGLRQFMIPIALSAFTAIFPANAADDLQSRAEKITVGAQEAAVVAIMGKPDLEVGGVAIGLGYGKLVWASNGRMFSVFLIKGHVVLTKTCVGSNITDC